ncbi:MAG: hypothetical protein AUJ92_06375 [Armatimonadetes bacterium CG2_30_59_28]|nr:HAD family phosphatase [Armatimonadota bacterium]OIO96300.1 MAG: hypothetical protein AUJ92_06375 [Armatimonadetes bacterium CG2_30_59_28]
MDAPAVIFDLDGVIVDSAEPHFISWQRLARENGLGMSAELFHETFGQPNSQVLPRLFDRYLCKSEIDRYSHRKEELYRDIVREAVVVFPGALDLIHKLKSAGHRLAMGTSAPPENVELVVELLELGDVFDAMVTSRDVAHGKPNPEVFTIAAERLGTPPGRCVVIEDAIAGVEAARAAGMTCIAVTTTHPAESLQEADWIVGSLEDVSPTAVCRLINMEPPIAAP